MIVDPGRANRSRFTTRMIALGYRHQSERFDEAVDDYSRCRGHLLHFQRQG